MDFGFLGRIDFTPAFLGAVLSITLIDLVLAGDNAVVIALAVKSLHGRQRRLGLVCGSAAAVLLRVTATFLCASLLQVPLVKLAGGAVIIWIAVKLLGMQQEEECGDHKEAGNILQALWIIVVADISMSIDNMLAVAGACKGNLFLLLFGLVVSIPLVVCGAGLLSMLMDRYPIIVWIGAAILGKVGGEMMITDPWIEKLIHTTKTMEWASILFFIAFVLIYSGIRKKRAACEKDGSLQDPRDVVAGHSR
jgi:YjbE family integral membrane protein